MLQIKPLPVTYMHTAMGCCTLTKWTRWNLAFPAVISASSTLIKYPHYYNVFGSTSVEYDAETKGVFNLQLIWSQLCFHTTFCILITWIWEHIFQNHETIVGHVFASILYESAQTKLEFLGYNLAKNRDFTATDSNAIPNRETVTAYIGPLCWHTLTNSNN